MPYSFAVEWMVQGYHGYKSIWENPSEDNKLREVQKTHDTHAVSIEKPIVSECHTVEHKKFFCLLNFHKV